ncbi:MAG: hypothetical protein ACXVEE_14375 [Polyangiales bacterium]
MRADVVFAIALASLCATQRTSRACLLVVTRGPRITPGPLDHAPLNTRVFARMEADWSHGEICPSGWDNKKTCPKGDFSLVMRTAATLTAASAEVPFEIKRTVKQGDDEFLELAPKALAAKTRYEVLLVERAARVPPQVVGTFATTDAADGTAPTWKGITRNEVTVPTPGVFILCGGPETTVTMDVDPPVDASPVRFEVFVSAPGGAIDLGKPPRAVVASERLEPKAPLRVFLAAPMIPNGKDVRIALRPIDSAGNTGTVSEIVVDTTPKAKKPKK